MGKRGPAKTPSNVVELRGNPDHRPKNHSEPKPPPIAPSCPYWLDRRAKNEWKRVVALLEPLGLITQIDRAALAAYCQCYSEWVQADEVIQEQGMNFETPNGYLQQRPEVAIRQKARADMLRFAARFGLTPSDRAGLKVPENNGPSEFERWLNDEGAEEQ